MSVRVQVLLSTYNGGKFIDELMDSVLSQDYPLRVLVRDDGSVDDTVQRLKRYRAHGVEVVEGENVGVTASFLDLIARASPDAVYFALCDQDDVWLEDKVSRAVMTLHALQENLQRDKQNNQPLLYCSRYTLVDESLRTLGLSDIPKRGPAFENALVQTIAPGCTMVFDRAARDLLKPPPDPQRLVMHDLWLYQVVSAFGTVIYDSEPRVLYRQHSSNVIGAKTGALQRWRARAKRLRDVGGTPLFYRQAAELRRVYGAALPPEKRAVLERFLGSRDTLRGRVLYAVQGRTYRQTRTDDVLFRMLMLLDRV